jgi:thiazole/oxazole-forming peptide maturase SagD family component
MIQTLKHSWKREVTLLGNSLHQVQLIFRLAWRLLIARRIERVSFADIGTDAVVKCDVRFRYRTETHYAYGVAHTVREALLKALAETAERLISYDANEQNQIDLEVVQSKMQFAGRTYTSMRSVIAKDIKDVMQVVIPAHCIRRWNKKVDDVGSYVFPYTTNGLAAHTNRSDALHNALCEVIERDAFLCYWYARTAPERVDMASAPEEVLHLLNVFKKMSIEVAVLHLPHESGIPVIAAVGSAEKGGGVRRVLALGCSESLDDAVTRALYELFIVKSHLYVDTATPAKHFEAITAFERARLWRGSYLAQLDYFISGPYVEYKALSHQYASKKDVFDMQEEAYVYTYKNIIAIPLIVVKVIVPSYFPFFLNERYKYFGEERLRRFCESRGVPFTMSEIPHVLP